MFYTKFVVCLSSRRIKFHVMIAVVFCIILPCSKLYIYTFLLLRNLYYMLSRNRVSKSDIKVKVVPVRDMKALAGVEVGSHF